MNSLGRQDRTVDLLINKTASSTHCQHASRASQEDQDCLFVGHDQYSLEELVVRPPIIQFLVSCLEAITDGKAECRPQAALKFFLPATNGYIVRSDFLGHRLSALEMVAKVSDFVKPLEQVKPCLINGNEEPVFASLIASAVGVISLKSSEYANPVEALALLEIELQTRIAYPWLLSSPSSEKRIALVEGRKDIELSKRVWEAASGLGIKIVIIDEQGHWLENDEGPYAHLREAFVPTDITDDKGFVDRIISAVRTYPYVIDGVMTFDQMRLISVAKVCEMLHLPTSPSASYILAADKYRTRVMEPTHEGAFQVSSTTELEDQLKNPANTPLTYPLIVKPTLGWSSECVTKVASQSELFSAVGKASARHASSPQRSRTVAIEPYIDGPEVDANFVLLNGELLFFEVIDDFPSTGDSESTSSSSNFFETELMMPSKLPAPELAALRSSIHQSILRQGFVTGCFHCEARLRNSRTEYRIVDGVKDLYLKSDSTEPESTIGVWLLEINARPPGYMETAAVALVYGVDYFALQMLFSIGDDARFKVLARPFRNGPQANLLVQFVPQDKAGIMKSEDPGAELLERNPDIAEYVTEYKTWKKGERLVGSEGSVLMWMAYFLIMHKERSQCLRIGGEILRKFRHEVEEY